MHHPGLGSSVSLYPWHSHRIAYKAVPGTLSCLLCIALSVHLRQYDGVDALNVIIQPIIQLI
jgi:hypothetical protein